MIAADYLNQRDNAGIRDSKAVSSSQITAMAMMAVGNNTATTKSGTAMAHHTGSLIFCAGGTSPRASDGRRFHHITQPLTQMKMTARQNTTFASTLHQPSVPMCSAILTAMNLPKKL